MRGGGLEHFCQWTMVCVIDGAENPGPLFTVNSTSQRLEKDIIAAVCKAE